MVARAVSKYIRISGRKVNKYGRIIRNLPYKEARAALMHTPSHGAKVLGNVVQSAVSNLMAKSKNIDEDTITVDKVIVNEGPTLKRWKPRARGRADRIRKRTCHISIEVSGEEIQK
jgi:large subunit ribosomal protein L22